MSKVFLDKILKNNKNLDGIVGYGLFLDERPRISTGSISLDLKLGGGLPRDRIIEFYGKPSSWKTSAALWVMKNYVDTYGYEKAPFIIDMERSITSSFIRSFGLDPNKIIGVQPKTAESALDSLCDIIESGEAGFGIYDSVDAMETEKETDRTFKDASMAEVAKLMSRAMRRLCKSTVDNDCGIIFINQMRASMCISPDTKIIWRTNNELD